MKCLQGQLLLASRRLADPNFFHAVILMIQHGEDGALGLVLNRPLDITVKQACDDALEMVCKTDGMLHQGGPCQGPLMALHGHERIATSGEEGQGQVVKGVYFSTERQELEWLLRQVKPKAMFFVGYAGWGPGQLEDEIDSGSWLVMEASDRNVFDVSDGDHWGKLVTQLTLGGRINTDLIPDDPSVN